MRAVKLLVRVVRGVVGKRFHMVLRQLERFGNARILIRDLSGPRLAHSFVQSAVGDVGLAPQPGSSKTTSVLSKQSLATNWSDEQGGSGSMLAQGSKEQPPVDAHPGAASSSSAQGGRVFGSGMGGGANINHQAYHVHAQYIQSRFVPAEFPVLFNPETATQSSTSKVTQDGPSASGAGAPAAPGPGLAPPPSGTAPPPPPSDEAEAAPSSPRTHQRSTNREGGGSSVLFESCTNGHRGNFDGDSRTFETDFEWWGGASSGGQQQGGHTGAAGVAAGQTISQSSDRQPCPPPHPTPTAAAGVGWGGGQGQTSQSSGGQPAGVWTTAQSSSGGQPGGVGRAPSSRGASAPPPSGQFNDENRKTTVATSSSKDLHQNRTIPPSAGSFGSGHFALPKRTGVETLEQTNRKLLEQTEEELQLMRDLRIQDAKFYEQIRLQNVRHIFLLTLTKCLQKLPVRRVAAAFYELKVHWRATQVGFYELRVHWRAIATQVGRVPRAGTSKRRWAMYSQRNCATCRHLCLDIDIVCAETGLHRLYTETDRRI